MRRLHIVGRKNHGKTTLCCELIATLAARGLRVGAIKHSIHRHEVDVPGKDSHQLRAAGADPTSFWSGGLCAVYLPELPESELYERLTPLYADCDLVLCEGHKTVDDAPCLEVWRQCIGDAPLACNTKSIQAVISDDRPPCDLPWWPRADLSLLCDRIATLLDSERTAMGAGRQPTIDVE